jgi:peroxiredoxin
MLQTGDRAPEFVLPNLDGSQSGLQEWLGSGSVCVVFLKVNCPTCQYTFPFLQRFTVAAGLTLVGISQNEARSTRQFCERYGVKFPVLLDRAEAGYPVSNAYRITHVPSLFLIDTDGTISRSFSGYSRKDLEELGHRFQFVPFSANEQIHAFKPG